MTGPLFPRTVAIDVRAGQAHGISGALPVGAIVVAAGVVLRVRPDGGLDEIPAGGHPRGGIGRDPTAAGDEVAERLRQLARQHPPSPMPAPVPGALSPPRPWSDTDEES